MESQTIYAIIAVILLFLFMSWGMVVPKSTPTVFPANTERLNPGFNPTHDRTNTQQEYDRQMDYIQDEKGNTPDDYMLEDLLFQNHAASITRG